MEPLDVASPATHLSDAQWSKGMVSIATLRAKQPDPQRVVYQIKILSFQSEKQIRAVSCHS